MLGMRKIFSYFMLSYVLKKNPGQTNVERTLSYI